MRPKCKLIGENGNVFNLIGLVRTTLKKNDLHAELEQFDGDLKKLQDGEGQYNDVLMLLMQYVEVE